MPGTVTWDMMARPLWEGCGLAGGGIVRHRNPVSPPQSSFVPTRSQAQLIPAADALARDDLPVAERLLKAHLRTDPYDVAAIRMLAELAARIGRTKDAETLLRRAIALAPDWVPPRSNLALLLHRQNRSAEAMGVLVELTRQNPDDMGLFNLHAAVASRIGEYDEALSLYARVLETVTDQPKVWMSYGHVLKTVGRQDDCIAAYRRALSIAPGLGEVWWSLANLKTVKFDDADIAAMQGALKDPTLTDDDRLHLHFALGKGLGDRAAGPGENDAAFAHYATGNALRLSLVPYDPADTTTQVDRAIATYGPAYFTARADGGDPSPDPIFILGMPRAGSTLIEQILASHSAVEGTMELPDMPAMAAEATRRTGKPYPEAVAHLSPDDAAELGQDYLRRTRVQRKTDRPLFIDKLPNNWLHVGLIRTILPNAKIIDARRDPMDCCFSNWRQHFARGQAFAYDLDHLGRYYADYVRLMRHFDAVQPGMVHRVIHEDLLADPEAEVRRLLAYVGLPWDAACLNFHTNARAVRTASSEQVRRPLNRDGVGQWLPYAEQLQPLRDALGQTLDDWRD